MSVSAEEMTAMGVIGKKNLRHGVCGFVSVLSAAYELAPQTMIWQRVSRRKGIWAPAYRRIIGDFLDYLSNEKPEIIVQIQEFTRTFPSFEEWDIETYFYHKLPIDKALRKGREKPPFNISIGMPKEAVLEYIKFLGGLPVCIQGDKDIPVGSIIGLGEDKNLQHYIYKNLAGKFISWGEEYTSIESIPTKQYKILFHIRPCFQA